MTLTLKKDIQKHIVTAGNYGFAAAGQPLFSYVGKGKSARIIYNVAPGQLVAYTVTNGVTLTVTGATLAASDIYELYVGVGVDLNGDGVTDDIRHIGIEHVSGCQPREVSTSSPRCGGPQVTDFYFDCTKCDETYSVMVRVDDNQTRSFSPWNKSFSEFVGSIVTNCSSCDDCPVEHNCKEVACKLADALNGELDLKIGNNGYPDWKGQGLPRPFFATRLHANSTVYCLGPKTDAELCEDCTYIDAIGGANINGTFYPFTGVVNPADDTQAFIGQVDSIVAQLNEAFITEYSQGQEGVNPHAGSAYATGSYQQCCPIQLHVNTCDETFELLDNSNGTGIEGSPIYGVKTNPFTVHGTVTTPLDCIDCDDSPTSSAFPCGIRVIAEQIKGDCNCYIDQPLAFYGRKIEILPFGEGWRGKPWRVKEVQAMELPSGFGAWIQWLEYQDLPEGRGRRFSRSNVNKGWANLPDKKSRIKNAVTAKCDKNYCSYYMKSFVEKKKLSDEYGVITVHSNVHIPNTDATTIAAWELFFSALIGFNPSCKQLTTVSCDEVIGVCPTPTATPAPTATPTPTPTATVG